jgi:hypothetical protein
MEEALDLRGIPRVANRTLVCILLQDCGRRYMMNRRVVTSAVGTVLLLVPGTFSQSPKPSPTKPAAKQAVPDGQTSQAQDMQDAIAWERRKEAAAARWARIEAKHPSVTYDNNADRKDQPGQVKDPGPAPKK